MQPIHRVAALVAVLVLAVAFSQAAQAEGVATAADGVRASAVASKAPTWWGLLTRSGDPLAMRRVTRGPLAGKAVVGLVIGERYKVRGRLPARLRDALAGKRLTLEAKPVGGSTWTALTRFRSDRNGRFLAGVRVPKRLLGVHTYRLTAPSATRQTGSSTALPGGTVPAVANSSFTLTLTNDTKTDLVFTFPTAQDPTSGQYGNGVVQVAQNASQTLTYVNPIQNVTTVGFTAQRQSCFMGCSTYSANWDHAPNKNYTPCNAVSPTFSSGGAYTIRTTPEMGTSGFDMFLLDASGNVICTGALSTSFSQWMGNHPVAKWAFIYIAVDAAVNAAALAVIGFAGEAIAAAVTAEVTVDAFADYEAAEIVVEETDEDGACEFQRVWNLLARNPSTFSVDSNPSSYVDSNCSATF